MKNKKRLVGFITGLLLLLSIFIPTTAMATEPGNGSSISVRAIIPENQYDKDVTYFYLLVKPNDTQVIEVELNNVSDKDKEVDIKLNPATTNDNGLIDYTTSDKDKELDPSLKHPFNKIATTETTVKIPAQGKAKAEIKLQIPSEEFDGMVLGGINITEKGQDKNDDDKKKGGMKIVNELKYNIGVVLIENENPVKEDMKLNNVKAGQIMGVNTIKVNLQNPTSALIENITYDAKIYKKDGKEPLYETKRENFRMAPNSNFNLGVDMGTARYQGGKYRIKLVATSEESKETWSWDEEFEITQEEAKALNEKAADLDPDYKKYFIIGGIILLLIIILIVLIVISRNKKKKAAAARKRKSKSHSSSKSSKKRK